MKLPNILIAFIAFLLILLLLLTVDAQAATIRQDAIHDVAETLREYGFKDDSKPIQALSEAWWQEQADLHILATVIYNEAWFDCTDRHRELVAAIVVNRVKSDKFPNTIYEVVTAPNQYHPAYADMSSFYAKRAMADPEAWEMCVNIATRALNDEIECPDDVLYQANFKQGTGVYETHKTSYSTTYFCYG